MANTAKQLRDFFSLKVGEENHAAVLKEVRQHVSFRNANLWILVCAILIASIGLNMNSTAVVIGAMLISPLMGPIVGAGFALATFDFELLKKALLNLLVATVVSLGVAALYFLISPFKETQSEILNRTAPNIYEVLIAFLSGVVGVISLTRVEKGFTIAGVAIATALMPPLCTAGFGLAVGNYAYLLGAFYLYSINCFFICIATFFITRYLRYPRVKSVDEKYDLRIKRWLTISVIIMLIPAGYFAYILYQEKSYAQRADNFIQEEFIKKGETLIYKKIRYHTIPQKIEIAILSRKYSQAEIEILQGKMKDFGLGVTQLVIKQDNKDLKAEILREMGDRQSEATEKNLEITTLHERLQSYSFNNGTLNQEMKALFPEIKSYSIGRHQLTSDTTASRLVLLYALQKNQQPDTTRLRKWVQAKWPMETVAIVAEPSSSLKDREELQEVKLNK